MSLDIFLDWVSRTARIVSVLIAALGAVAIITETPPAGAASSGGTALDGAGASLPDLTIWNLLINGPSQTGVIPPRLVPPVEIHYAPQENLEAIDAKLIGTASRSIDMDAYVLTDRTVARALTAAAARGVKVRLWRETSEPGLLDDRPGAIEVRFKPPGELMHLKSYCVDDAVLRTGSANFSHSGERYQDNDLVILRGPGACSGFEAKFERAWGTP